MCIRDRTLITLGKTLEARAKGKTSDAITKLMNLAPKTATVERDGKELQVPVEEVQLGETLIVKAGESVPVDGIVIEGFSSVDESALTGESIPVEKHIGDKVIGATTSKSGYFKMQATKVGDDTTLAQIVRLVDEATSSKAPIAKLADKVSGVFVPVVISIALIAVIVWRWDMALNLPYLSAFLSWSFPVPVRWALQRLRPLWSEPARAQATVS